MATTNELKFQITADGTKAKAEIKGVDAAIHKMAGGSAVELQKGFKNVASEASNLMAVFTGDRLTGITSQFTSLGNAIGAIPGPAGLAVGAVAAIGTAAVGTGVALFELTKQAAEFGSTIHDASVKTGLGAETISTLKLAADQSGSSLEQVTSGIAKFAKTVGAAGEDAKKSAVFVKEFGITPQAALKDLDGSLDKVFKRIGAAKPGVEQMTLAQKAFGKAGADLIPVMEQTGFNLEAYRKHAHDLGATLTDEDVVAADLFGDQMVELEAQLASVGRVIGFELMPEFHKMADEFSKWLIDNKSEIKYWAEALHAAFRGVVWEYRTIAWAIGAVYKSAQGLPVGASPRLDVSDIGGDSSRPTGGGGVSRGLPTDNTDTGGGGKGGRSAKDVFKLSPQGQAFANVAGRLGISPLDLATIVGFESAGSYSTSKTNSVGRFGLIQFGKSEGAQYGAFKGQGFEAQLEAAGRYLTDRFARVGKTTAGASILDLYRTVLGGSPNASLTGTDAYGTSPSSGVARMLKTNRPNALNRFFGGKASNVPGDSEYSKYLQELQKDKEAEIKAAEEAAKRRVEIGQSMTESLIDLAQHEYEANLKAGDYEHALGAARQVHDLKKQLIQDEITGLEEKYQRSEKGSDAEAEAFQQLTIKKLEAAKLERAADDDLDAHRETLHQNEIKRIDRRFDAYHKRMAAMAAEERRLDDEEEQWANAHLKADEERRHQMESESILGGSGIGGGIGRGLGVRLPSIFDDNNQVKSQADYLKGVYADLADSVGQSVGAMVQGLAQLGATWLITGEISGKAALAMIASTALQIATQAGFQAIFEFAEAAKETALAAGDLAIGNVVGAGLHTTAAAAHHAAAITYLTVAAVAGGVGVGAGLGARALGGGGGSGGGNGQQEQHEVNQNPSPYTRVSQNAYLSGTRNEINNLATEVRALHQKIGSMSPGDILTRGTQQKRGHIAETLVKEIGSNGGHGRKLGVAMGIS